MTANSDRQIALLKFSCHFLELLFFRYSHFLFGAQRFFVKACRIGDFECVLGTYITYHLSIFAI